MDTFEVFDYKFNELAQIEGCVSVKDDVIIFYNSVGRMDNDIIAVYNTKNVFIRKMQKAR